MLVQIPSRTGEKRELVHPAPYCQVEEQRIKRDVYKVLASEGNTAILRQMLGLSRASM